MKNKIIGYDLFSGAGGMSLGANLAGVDIQVAVEIDKAAAMTYKFNHSETKLINDDIRKVSLKDYISKNRKEIKVLFGGPPCRGFSTSNQKTRNKSNKENWLFREYIRIAKEIKPDWVIIENVKGLIDTENGYFFENIIRNLKKSGYQISYSVLNAVDYGVPQVRNRVFIVGSLHGINFIFPKATHKNYISVYDAISDLPQLNSGAKDLELDYRMKPINGYQKRSRKNSNKSVNNFVTDNSKLVLKRFEYVPPGGNWKDIPRRLMKNYKDFSRCHTRIYHRLEGSSPSVVIGNYRKNMLIHPFENRGLSVREAARIQSFPDNFHFFGTIGYQQQQVGNSVPPLLAKRIFNKIVEYSD